jgi:cell wall-associated NlpC family hydrolase
VRIGVFEMAAADNYSVLFSPGTDDEDYVAADAVKVIKVSSGTAPSKLPESDASANTTGRDVAKEARTGESGSPRAVSASSKGQDVVKEARAYMGIPYRLGRESRSGMGCSGFTRLVYRKFGVSLPRDVVKQSRYGSRVSGPPKPATWSSSTSTAVG